MRFIGNKENILDKIYQTLESKKISGDSFFDFFSGTSNVARYYKKKGYQVYSSDLLYFSYVLQHAYIKNNTRPKFSKLLPTLQTESQALIPDPLDSILSYLNKITPVAGFIFKNYCPTGTAKLKQPRMYFSDENGMLIDAVRSQIELWYTKNLINQDEYFILLACLIETVPFYANITGVFAAYQKKWDPRALKRLKLRPIEIVSSNKIHESYNANTTDILCGSDISVDILYLDPPYNQRQYAPNYHVLETIAKNDSPEIKGITGMRDYKDQKSVFCNTKTALLELGKIAKEAKFKSLVLSYNSEGIMQKNDILNTLGRFGEVELVEFDYPRFKSNNNGESTTKKFIKEQLYILKKYER